MRFASPQGFNSGTQFFDYLKMPLMCCGRGIFAPKMMSIGLHGRISGDRPVLPRLHDSWTILLASMISGSVDDLTLLALAEHFPPRIVDSSLSPVTLTAQL